MNYRYSMFVGQITRMDVHGQAKYATLSLDAATKVERMLHAIEVAQPDFKDTLTQELLSVYFAHWEDLED